MHILQGKTINSQFSDMGSNVQKSNLSYLGALGDLQQSE